MYLGLLFFGCFLYSGWFCIGFRNLKNVILKLILILNSNTYMWTLYMWPWIRLNWYDLWHRTHINFILSWVWMLQVILTLWPPHAWSWSISPCWTIVKQVRQNVVPHSNMTGSRANWLHRLHLNNRQSASLIICGCSWMYWWAKF